MLDPITLNISRKKPTDKYQPVQLVLQQHKHNEISNNLLRGCINVKHFGWTAVNPTLFLLQC